MAILLADVFFISLTIIFYFGDFSPRQTLMLVMFSTAIMCVVVLHIGVNDDTSMLIAVVIVYGIFMLRHAYKTWKKQKASKFEINN